MTKYQLFMNGQNFLINVDGKISKHGFYQNIFIEAENIKRAEFLGVEKIRADKSFRETILNSKDDPPIIFLESYAEIDEITEEQKVLEKGRAFYCEKKWWQFWK